MAGYPGDKMDALQSVTLDEIRSQTEAWEEAIQVVDEHRSEIERLDLSAFDQVVFSGCGSTYYLSLAAANIFQELARKASRAVPASEALLNPSGVYSGSRQRAILVAVSRSGTTSETLQAVKAFKNQNRGAVVSVTNYPESPLAQLGDINLCIPMGKEQSIAQTRSFASMLVACTAFSILAGGHPEDVKTLSALVSAGNHVIHSYEEFAREIAIDPAIQRIYFLGSGYQYGLACEASLKMKEMSLSVSEPFHFLEFRHGPISMVDPSTLVVGLLSEDRREYEEAVLGDIRKLGGQVLSISEADADVCFQSTQPEIVRGVLYLPFVQLLAYYRAISHGLNPDLPRNLTAVVKLDFPDPI
jgi:glutamine---fructose-6-phosphate transaminase (isomerizing)